MYKFITISMLIAVTMFTITLGASEKYICNSKHLSITEMSVSCNNDVIPSVTKVGNTLIISCGVK